MKQFLQVIIPILLLTNAAFAQKLLEGEVKDSAGAPIVGATVVIKGTTIFTEVDSSGKFSLLTTKEFPLWIVVKYYGFQKMEIAVTDASPLRITMLEEAHREVIEVTVTSRRRKETAQDVPIPITVVGGGLIDNAGAFNVNRVKELVPSIQMYSSNPRNTGVNIRGLGSSYGLTNDGLDPGVGFYVDGIYHVRPAVATFDFIDVDQIEVLRGPQGTLFGKNTTSGALNITTRKASFTPGATFEVSTGNYGYVQAKASVTGPFSKKVAGRLSFSGTQRNGVIENVATGKWINDINNQGVRGQVLYRPNDKLDVTLAGDFSSQRPDGYAQVVAGVAPTQRAAYRQFDAIITDLNYELPSRNAFDRKVDHDTPWKSGNDQGGTSLTIDYKVGPGTLTSATSWRYWHWDPSNDRDFTGLQSLAKSQNPAKHQNWTQEIRYAAKFSDRLSAVVGVFAIGQEVKIRGTEESGDATWRFAQDSPSALWTTPGLFEGFGIKTNSDLKSFSGAVFGQVDWNVFKGLHILPGIRYNYDEKIAKFSRETYGGLENPTPAQQALKNKVYTNQAFNRGTDNTNLTYNITASYKFSDRFNTFATYSTNFKTVGVNLAGLPSVPGKTAEEVAEELGVIKPEFVQHAEFGIKTKPIKRSSLNLTLFNTEIENYQTQVQAAEPGVNRGYLANAERVRVYGAELDANVNVSQSLSIYGAVAYTDGRYVRFSNAPLPLEETGQVIDGVQVAFKDISGATLPGISKWAGSLGTELSRKAKFFGNTGRLFVAIESSGRTKFSSSSSPSKYLNVNEYALLNARFGFRATEGLTFFFWGRNVLDKDYHEQLLPAGGNAGQYASQLGDPRTYGVTLRYSL